MADEKQLEVNHEELMKKLKKDYEDADKKFKALLKTNTDAENLLRKDFKKVSSSYTENMKQYDNELKNQTKDNEKTLAEYDDTLADLNNMKEQYNMLLEEKRKRDEIAAMMQKRKDEQNAKMDKLI